MITAWLFFLLIKSKFVSSDGIKENRFKTMGKYFTLNPEECFLITAHSLSTLGICILFAQIILSIVIQSHKKKKKRGRAIIKTTLRQLIIRMLEEIIISFLQRYSLHLLNDLSNVSPKYQNLTKMSYNLKSKGIKKVKNI